MTGAEGNTSRDTWRRGRPKRTIAAAVAVAVVIAAVSVGAVLLRPDGDAPTAGGMPTGHAHAPAEPSSARTASAPPETVVVFEGTPVTPPESESAGSEPMTTLQDAATGAAPRDGAEGLGDPRDPIDADSIVDPSTALGGCLAEYGTAGQCLPVVPPSLASHFQDMVDAGLDTSSMPHPWSCAEVRLLFPEGLDVRVAGVDPQALDDDGDGVACEPDS